MEEILRHTINKLISPKFGDIHDFVAGISHTVGKHYTYYYAVYDVSHTIDPQNMMEIRNKTYTLFSMLGTGRLDEIDITFRFHKSYS